MKKLILAALLATTVWSVDFSQMSTEELMAMRGTLSAADRPAFRAEMQKRMQSMSPEQRQQLMQSRGKGMMQGKGRSMGQGKGRNSGQNRPTFSMFDTNGDGVVTEKEFYDAQAAKMAQKANAGKMMKNAANAPTFESIDTNHDKVIIPSEFNTYQAQKMNAKMRAL